MPTPKSAARKKRKADRSDAHQQPERKTKKPSDHTALRREPRRKSRGTPPRKASRKLTELASAETSCRQDVREALFNARTKGLAHEVSVKRDEVAAIHGFMIDIDLKMLDPKVIGRESAKSRRKFYEEHVSTWLDRDPTLSKAEVRDTGGGLHVLLWLDEPLICGVGQQEMWDKVARGIRQALPGDPNVNGINAMTRPVGETNGKFDPPRLVKQLREGRPVSKDDVLAFASRLTTDPAHFWMNLFFGSEKASPCPLCQGQDTSLGIAGAWRVRCYQCGSKDASSLVYRFYRPAFRGTRKEGGA
jgi:hypothetical protein